MKKIGIIQLGCTKNQVDTEHIIYNLSSTGIEIVENLEKADIILINTCGFINSAKEQSIDAIYSALDIKNINPHAKVYVIGCLVKRYKNELKKEIPEVDGFFSFEEYKELENLIKNKDSKQELKPFHYNLSESANVFYLKISEGCSNNCTYCTIPLIRGPLKPFPITDIKTEFEFGVFELKYKEVNIIAQDLASYHYENYNLTKLLTELLKYNEYFWLRLLYIHPYNLYKILDELIEIMKDNRICKYIDLPIQHIDDQILKAMNRKHDSKLVYFILDKLKNTFPDLTIRSSFIVGFPGETKTQFNKLKKFIQSGLIDRAGFFDYSREENTPAYNFRPQLQTKTKLSRKKELEEIFKEILYLKNKHFENHTLEVIIDDQVDKDLYIGRSQYEAPEIDNVIFIESDKILNIGEFYNVKIIEAKETELFATIL